MEKMIASTYEILREIGSGGGGIVYLARHIRLDKLVVLKADKRTLSTKPEALRREVDSLKNLHHTFIPQVYDYLEEDGVVYTVMEYIQGESFDKALARGDRFSQAQVIGWACQLLEALRYLHSRPPYGILHGDIKPANIMLTPEGNICLIDFNITLALGEKGAIKVGFSRGYASPEHYGIDYRGIGQTTGWEDPATQITELPETQLEDSSSPKTVLPSGSAHNSSSSTSGKPPVLLDVRSDIYSLGATLYHLFTGQRPANDAKDVDELPMGRLSPSVAAIIRKAMAPNPDRRYQSAEEMLRDFSCLHDKDPKTLRYKRTVAGTATALAVVFLMGGFLTFTGLKQMERTENAYALAEYSAQALRRGDVEEAVSLAAQALPEKRGLFDAQYTPQAQRALTQALGIYDLDAAFTPSRLLKLESEPLKIVLSDSGENIAVLTQGRFTVFSTEDGTCQAILSAENSALCDAVFLSDTTLLYAGQGGVRAYDLDGQKELWNVETATALAASADHSRWVAVDRDSDYAALYNANGQKLTTVDFSGKVQNIPNNDIFADPEDALLTLDAKGNWLAVSFAGGGLSLFDLSGSTDGAEIFDASPYTHFEGGFFSHYFAFAANGETECLFAVIDTETLSQVGGFSGPEVYHVQADETGIYVATQGTLVSIDPETGEQTEVAYTNADITHFDHRGGCTVVSTVEDTVQLFDQTAKSIGTDSDGGRADFVQVAGSYAAAANNDTPGVRILRLRDHAEQKLMAYDPAYSHNEARVSADGKTVMLFGYQGFRLYDAAGQILAETNLPDPDNIYDQQYRRDEAENYLEVIYYDGTVRKYSTADGSLLSETKGDVPDASLYEEFFTDTLRFTSPLHGTPEVYDRNSGEKVGELEKDCYLTYVTQIDSMVVTEYITAQGERYGLLLDAQGGILADLPHLCDILPDHTLVFDDMHGILRTSSLYSLPELIAMANDR